MGEQLYGDPALAIRELYQNALDACRYAQARLTFLKRSNASDTLESWTGRIRFQQGIDDAGRHYIECEDNGIGMDIRELTDTFTHAGRRFADTPEFIEEQAEWLAHDVRLYPNSQFGVGVLSYFMLADDFEVDTCRMDRNGLPGESIHAAISGSGSLIRLRSGSREQCGTRIRLFLNRNGVSTVNTLEELLWLAEFETEASDHIGKLHWTAGRLGHDEKFALHAAMCATGSPYFWWKAVGGFDWPGLTVRRWERDSKAVVLADGIITESKTGPPYCVVNLRQEKRPSLTIDRKEVLEWNNDWIPATADNESHHVASWNALCLTMLWRIRQVSVLAEDRAWDAIKSGRSQICLENIHWPLGGDSIKRTSRRKRTADDFSKRRMLVT